MTQTVEGNLVKPLADGAGHTFHGDTGAGLGAGHQTGWTGLIAPLLRFFATTTAAEFLEQGASGSFLARGRKEAWPTSAQT